MAIRVIILMKPSRCFFLSRYNQQVTTYILLYKGIALLVKTITIENNNMHGEKERLDYITITSAYFSRNAMVLKGNTMLLESLKVVKIKVTQPNTRTGILSVKLMFLVTLNQLPSVQSFNRFRQNQKQAVVYYVI